jgi:hypothetical protein
LRNELAEALLRLVVEDLLVGLLDEVFEIISATDAACY